jgi:S1-C subfamily serine protease
MNKNTCTISQNMLFFIIILSSTVAIVGIYSVTNPLTQSVNALIEQQRQQPVNTTTIFDLQSQLLNSIFYRVENSVVQITSKVPLPLSSSSSSPNPSNPDKEQNATALGSGFVYDTKGHIVTNNHLSPILKSSMSHLSMETDILHQL